MCVIVLSHVLSRGWQDYFDGRSRGLVQNSGAPGIILVLRNKLSLFPACRIDLDPPVTRTASLNVRARMLGQTFQLLHHFLQPGCLAAVPSTLLAEWWATHCILLGKMQILGLRIIVQTTIICYCSNSGGCQMLFNVLLCCLLFMSHVHWFSHLIVFCQGLHKTYLLSCLAVPS